LKDCTTEAVATSLIAVSDNANESSNSPRPKFSIFGTASDGAVSRERIIGLDGMESKLGFFAAGILFVYALISLLYFLKGKASQEFVYGPTPSVKHVCTSGYTFSYHLAAPICQKTLGHPHSYWTFQLVLSLTLAIVVAFVSWRRSRAALIVLSFITGLTVQGAAGFPFIALAAWLLIRAFRLQKYGDPTFKGSNAVARERGRNRQPRGKAAAPEIGKAAPAPSKRYTPKKKPRR